MKKIRSSTIATLLLMTLCAGARDLFVKPGEGSGGDGSFASPWESLTEACAALQPGDVLTLLPGEYVQPEIKITAKGTAEQRIVIQGTHRDLSVLTAWQSIDAVWSPVPGQRFVFQTKSDLPVCWISDVANGVMLEPAPSLHDMDRYRGTWFVNREENIVYVHSLDGKKPQSDSIKITINSGHILQLSEAEHITSRNLTFCGSAHVRPKLSARAAAIQSSKTVGLIIEDCSFYLNSGGVNVVGQSLDTTVRRCFFQRNESFGYSEMAQLFFGGKSRNNLAEDNIILDGRSHGLRFYSSAEDVTARGNIIINERIGLYYKASNGERRAEHNVVLSCGSFNYQDRTPTTSRYNTLAKPSTVAGPDHSNLVFDHNRQDPRFCAPEHLDFRLQADSPFAGQGAWPEPAPVYYITPSGDDNNDGKSTERAWRTMATALKHLKAGDTLYLAPGEYTENTTLSFTGPLSIKGLGENQEVIISGMKLSDSRQVLLENLEFESLAVRNSQDVDLRRLVSGSFVSEDSQELRVKQCEFDNLRWERVQSSELIFSVFPENSVFDACTDLLQGYNAVQPSIPAGRQAQVTGARRPGLSMVKPRIENVAVQAVSPTGATLAWEVPDLNSDLWRVRNTWWNVRPVFSILEYGETEECNERSASIGDLFHHVNLRDLKPGTRYFYRVVVPEKMAGLNNRNEITIFDSVSMQQNWEGRHETGLQSFVTPSANTFTPRELYVAPVGRDKGDGSSPEQPISGLQAAALQARPGDTLLLLPGTYNETYYGLVSGLPDQPITLKAVQPGTVILEGSDYLRPGALHLYACDHYIIDGLIIRNYSNKFFASRAGMEYGQLQAIDCRNLTIRNCVFSGFGIYQFLISIKGCSDVLIQNNVFADGVNSITGGNNGDITIVNNTFFVPLIYHFTLISPVPRSKVTVRNNLFLAQSAMKALGAICRCMLEGDIDIDFDANAWYFPPEDNKRFIGLEGYRPPEDCVFPAGLERVRQTTGHEKNGLELESFTFRDHPFVNPMDRGAYGREVTSPFVSGKILPTLEYFATDLKDVGAQPIE